MYLVCERYPENVRKRNQRISQKVCKCNALIVLRVTLFCLRNMEVSEVIERKQKKKNQQSQTMFLLI